MVYFCSKKGKQKLIKLYITLLIPNFLVSHPMISDILELNIPKTI